MLYDYTQDAPYSEFDALCDCSFEELYGFDPHEDATEEDEDGYEFSDAVPAECSLDFGSRSGLYGRAA